MKEILSFQRKKKFYIWLALAAFIGSSYFFLKKDPIQKVSEERISITKKVHLVLPQLLRVWRGEVKVDRNCRDFGLDENSPDFAWECNPMVLECIAKSSRPYIQGPSGEEKIFFTRPAENLHFFKVLSRSLLHSVSEYGFQFFFRAEDGSEVQEVVLEDSCRDSYLKERTYLTGSFDDLEQKSWDNIGKKYFLDKTLVLNLDFYLWGMATGDKKRIEKYSDPRLWYFPVLNIPREQQNNYCLFRGKKIMTSHLYDAATFLPQAKSIMLSTDKGFFPWSREKSKEILSEQLVEKGDYCQQLFSYQCFEKFSHWHIHVDGATWSGLRGAVGGVMEAMREVWSARTALKISSYAFPMGSPFLKAGLKGYWDGEGFSLRSVDPKLSDGSILDYSIRLEELPIGFRCYQERH